MFKLTQRGKRLLVGSTIVGAGVLGYLVSPQDTVITINNPSKTEYGVVVAYYENKYQKYAITKLESQNKIEQWPCLYELWNRESNWNPHAKNKRSSAYGIPQLLTSTEKLIGFKRTDNGFHQVDAGLKYIKRHFGGNYCKALAHSLAKGYY